MTFDLNSAEYAAARHVIAVTGGQATLNDTGSAPGQFDVLIEIEDGPCLALEATSFGGDEWKATKSAVAKQRLAGHLAAPELNQQWWVIFPEGANVKTIRAGVIPLLVELEADGITAATSRYAGDEPRLIEIREELAALSLNSVSVWDTEPAEDMDRVLLSQSSGVIGTGGGALTAALAGVLAKSDNQAKLATADCDERHLYVVIEDHGADAVLQGMWPLPDCPPDPHGVIDVLWVYALGLSGFLFRVVPGTGDWQRYVAGSDELRNPA